MTEKEGQDPAEVALKMDNEPPEYHNDPPPSYDSVFGKVKKAKAESSGHLDFACRVVTLVFCGTICCGVWIFVMLALPIACIVIGVMYKDDCPRERYIPIYLIVAGCFGAIKALINMTQQVCKKVKGKGSTDEEEDKKVKPNPVDSVVSCFLLAWFIAGSVWVYRVYDDYQSDLPDQDDYCHQLLYTFSFWVLTVQYIILALTILCCCGMCIVMALAAK